MDERLADELVAMMGAQKDLMQRTGGGTPGPLPVQARLEQRRVFVEHGDRLRELLETAGRWPTAAWVGEAASRGAWLVAQHADTQLDVQRLALRLLREAVAEGAAEARDLAFLEDRVAVNEGRAQRYGTQIADVVDGHPVPWPVVDPERLDEWRAEAGIEPFAANAARYQAPAGQ